MKTEIRQNGKVILSSTDDISIPMIFQKTYVVRTFLETTIKTISEQFVRILVLLRGRLSIMPTTF